MTTNDGGPAFARPVGQFGVDSNNSQTGMSLRDYFAAHAPVDVQDVVDRLAIDVGEVVGPWPTYLVMQTMAELRYEYADAMLKEKLNA